MKTEVSEDERAALREIAAGCLCQKARNAARVLTRFYDGYFSESEIEPTQFNLLVAIRLSEPVSIIPLADRLGLERTTLTRNVNLLCRDGLVETTTGGDARQRLLSLTETGRQALRKNLAHWKRAQEAAMAVLGKRDFFRVATALSLSNKITRTGEINEK